jgi:hypothetical protein
VSLKVIVVGNGMVGKTSMITRFARGIMTDNYKKTIGTGPFRCSLLPMLYAHRVRLQQPDWCSLNRSDVM